MCFIKLIYTLFLLFMLFNICNYTAIKIIWNIDLGSLIHLIRLITLPMMYNDDVQSHDGQWWCTVMMYNPMIYKLTTFK